MNDKKASILQRTMIKRLTNFVYFGEPLNSSLDDFLEIASYVEVYATYSALLKLVQNRFISFEKNANDNVKKKQLFPKWKQFKMKVDDARFKECLKIIKKVYEKTHEFELKTALSKKN